MKHLGKKNISIVLSRYVKNQQSAREISNEMHIPIDRIYHILKKNNIARRSATIQNKIRFEKKKPSFNIKCIEPEKDILFIAGILLYWCEGAQWDGGDTVDFANSNTEMILLFLFFLRKICNVDKNRIRCYLYCYSNQDVQSLIEYWSRVTKIPKVQFSKPYVRHDFNEKKKGKMLYGLIHIRYCDKKLLLCMKNWIQIVPRKIMNTYGRLPK